MRFLFLFIPVLMTSSGHSQLKTGVRGLYGRSIMLNEMEPIRPPLDTYPNHYDHNFGGGVYLQYGFNDWLGIETSLIFEQLRTYEGYFVQADTTNLIADQLEFDENGLADYFSSEQWIRTNYLSIPLGVEFRLKRFRLGLGAQYSYLLQAGAEVKNWQFGTTDEHFEFQWADDFYFHRRHNFLAYAMIGFNIVENLSLEFKFSEGLYDISQEVFDHSKFWTRQFQFGLSYEFWPREKKEKVIDEGPDGESEVN